VPKVSRSVCSTRSEEKRLNPIVSGSGRSGLPGPNFQRFAWLNLPLGGKVGDDLPYAVAGLCRIARWRRFGRCADRHSIWQAATYSSARLSLSIAAPILAQPLAT
jgi:hypothetical protein